MAVQMTRSGTHVLLTITSDARIFQPRKQQIASDNGLLLVIPYTLTFVVLMTIGFGTHVSPTISSDATTLHVCKQTSLAINCY